MPADPHRAAPELARAYDFTTDRGALALNDYARANDPFAKLGKTQISVEVSSVIRAPPRASASPGSSATTRTASSPRPSAGPPSSPSSIETPRDADRLRKNPLGVYVNAINWSKELG